MPIEDATTTDVLEFARFKLPKLKEVDDQTVIEFIGETKPEFLKSKSFDIAYRTVKTGQAVEERVEKQRELEKPTPSKVLTRAFVHGEAAGALDVAAQYGGFWASPAGKVLANLAGVPGASQMIEKGALALASASSQKAAEVRQAGQEVGGGQVAAVGQMLAETGIASSPSLLAAIGSRNLGAAAVVGGLQSYGSNYQSVYSDLIKTGIPESEAKIKAMKVATASAVSTAGLTMAFGGTERFLAKIASGEISRMGAVRILREIGKSIGFEIPEEGLDQAIQGMVTKWVANPNLSTSKIVTDSILAASMGGLMAGGTTIAAGTLAGAVGAAQPEVIPFEPGSTRGAAVPAVTPTPQPPSTPAAAPAIPPPVPGAVSLVAPAPEIVASRLPATAVALANQEATLKIQTEPVMRGPATKEEVLGAPPVAPSPTVPTPAEPTGPVTPLWLQSDIWDEVRQQMEREGYSSGLPPTPEAPRETPAAPATAPEPTATPAPATTPVESERPVPAEAPAPPPPAEQPAPGGAVPMAPAAPEPAVAGPGITPPAVPPAPAPVVPEVSPEKKAEIETLQARRKSLQDQMAKLATANPFDPQITPLVQEASKVVKRIDELAGAKPSRKTKAQRVAEEKATARANTILRSLKDLRDKQAELKAQLKPGTPANKQDATEFWAVTRQITKLEDELIEVAGVESVRPNPSDLSFIPTSYFGPAVQRVRQWFTDLRAAARSVQMTLPVDMTSPVPRMAPWETFIALGQNPHGFGKILGAGTLLDPKATKDPVLARLNARAVGVHMGRNIAALWGETNKRFEKIFESHEDGTYSRGDGSVGYLSDDIEQEMDRPGSIPFSPEQRQFVQEWVTLWNDMRTYGQQMGMSGFVDDDGHVIPFGRARFPRPAIGKRNVSGRPQGGGPGGRVGAKPGYAKARYFKTEEAGVQSSDSIIYDPSVVSRVVKDIAAFYTNLFDKHLAEDPELGGRTSKEPPQYMREGRIMQPAFSGKIYSQEVADKVNKAFDQNVRDWARWMENASNAMKGAMLTMDFSAPLTQGLPLLFRSMARLDSTWPKAVALSARALLDPNLMAKQLARPEIQRGARDLILHGGTLFSLMDQMAGLKEGEWLTKLPAVGPAFTATGRSFRVFIDMAKIMLWNALSPVTPENQLNDLAQTLNYAVVSDPMVGVNPRRAIGEKLLFLAPMYYRGGAQLVARAAQRGVPGKLAREMMGYYSAGIVMQSIGFMWLAGLGWDEIKERLDPSKGKFLKVPVTLNSGETLEMGLGGIHFGFTRLLGEIYEYLGSNESVPALKLLLKGGVGPGGNPILRWGRGRAGPIPSWTADVLTERDFLGRPVGPVGATVQRIMPISLSVLRDVAKEGKRSLASSAIEIGASLFAVNVYPQAQYERVNRALDTFAQRKYGRDYEQLTADQQHEISQTVKTQDWYKKREVTPEVIAQANKYKEQIRSELTAAMPEPIRKAMADYGLKMTAYLPALTYRGDVVFLKEKQKERLRQLMVDEHANVLGYTVPTLAGMDQATREKTWEKRQARAKDHARSRLKNEMNAKGK